jgi:hypothetical protein
MQTKTQSIVSTGRRTQVGAVTMITPIAAKIATGHHRISASILVPG